jgi:hypothetical protein
MELLKTVAREAVGLFVSDARLVVSVGIWAAAIAYGLHEALISPNVAAILLALGVATLLVFDAVRVARAKAKGGR